MITRSTKNLSPKNVRSWIPTKTLDAGWLWGQKYWTYTEPTAYGPVQMKFKIKPKLDSKKLNAIFALNKKMKPFHQTAEETILRCCLQKPPLPNQTDLFCLDAVQMRNSLRYDGLGLPQFPGGMAQETYYRSNNEWHKIYRTYSDFYVATPKGMIC